MTGWEMYEKAKEELGAEYLLDALAQALTDDELKDNIKFICRMEDIYLKDDDDDEDEDEDEEDW